jgi:hypothetical protein
MMIERAAAPYIDRYPTTIVILEEHNKIFNSEQKLREVFQDRVNIVILENPTTGPADTVYQALQRGNINPKASILIKDSDGFYTSEVVDGNAIYVCNLNKNPHIKNVHAKSYTITNEQGIISSVVEKQIVSNNFCAGGYQFDTAAAYMETFETIRSTTSSEIFVSNIIDYMISQGAVFVEQEVRGMIDVGTAPDWFEFNDKPTYFSDIDGTIVKNRHPDQDWEPLTENIALLLREQSRGCKIIFCTARPRRFEQRTRYMLDSLGFKEYELIMAINHARRVVINDFASSVPYPSAEAINLPRDSDTLKNYITGV